MICLTQRVSVSAVLFSVACAIAAHAAQAQQSASSTPSRTSASGPASTSSGSRMGTAIAPGTASSWTAGKGSFGSSIQRDGIWRTRPAGSGFAGGTSSTLADLSVKTGLASSGNGIPLSSTSMSGAAGATGSSPSAFTRGGSTAPNSIPTFPGGQASGSSMTRGTFGKGNAASSAWNRSRLTSGLVSRAGSASRGPASGHFGKGYASAASKGRPGTRGRGTGLRNTAPASGRFGSGSRNTLSSQQGPGFSDLGALPVSGLKQSSGSSQP